MAKYEKISPKECITIKEFRPDERMTESGQFVIEKENDVSFSCVCPVIDNTFRHNIVKVVCGSHLHQNFLLTFSSCNLAVP